MPDEPTSTTPTFDRDVISDSESLSENLSISTPKEYSFHPHDHLRHDTQAALDERYNTLNLITIEPHLHYKRPLNADVQVMLMYLDSTDNAPSKVVSKIAFNRVPPTPDFIDNKGITHTERYRNGWLVIFIDSPREPDYKPDTISETWGVTYWPYVTVDGMSGTSEQQSASSGRPLPLPRKTLEELTLAAIEASSIRCECPCVDYFLPKIKRAFPKDLINELILPALTLKLVNIRLLEYGLDPEIVFGLVNDKFLGEIASRMYPSLHKIDRLRSLYGHPYNWHNKNRLKRAQRFLYGSDSEKSTQSFRYKLRQAVLNRLGYYIPPDDSGYYKGAAINSPVRMGHKQFLNSQLEKLVKDGKMKHKWF